MAFQFGTELLREMACVLDRAALWIYGTVFCFHLWLSRIRCAAVPRRIAHRRARQVVNERGHATGADGDRGASNKWLRCSQSIPRCALPGERSLGSFERGPIDLESPRNRAPTVGLKWYFMLPVCVLGVVIGDGFLYAIGRIWGTRLVESALDEAACCRICPRN